LHRLPARGRRRPRRLLRSLERQRRRLSADCTRAAAAASHLTQASVPPTRRVAAGRGEGGQGLPWILGHQDPCQGVCCVPAGRVQPRHVSFLRAEANPFPWGTKRGDPSPVSRRLVRSRVLDPGEGPPAPTARSRLLSRAGTITSRLASASGFPEQTGCWWSGNVAPELPRIPGAPAAAPRRAPRTTRTRTASETPFGGRRPSTGWNCEEPRLPVAVTVLHPPDGVDCRERTRAAEVGSATASAPTTGATFRPAAA
jgi:hypothetical protein